jgi:hypothetical protein
MDRLPDFETYRADALAKGYDEVLERRWAPGIATGTHSHPFDVAAVLVHGEMWLEQGPIAVHLVPGSGFELKANVPHSERYGPEGALFFSARRHAKEQAA